MHSGEQRVHSQLLGADSNARCTKTKYLDGAIEPREGRKEEGSLLRWSLCLASYCHHYIASASYAMGDYFLSNASLHFHYALWAGIVPEC